MKIGAKVAKIREKTECYLGERCVPPLAPKRIGSYIRRIDTAHYAVYEYAKGGGKVLAAYGSMLLLQDFRDPNQMILYPYYAKHSIRYRIRLNSRTFPGLLKNSRVHRCLLLPYMRKVGVDQYIRSVRLVVITDKAQIYHNYPARHQAYDGYSVSGDIVRFEESVVWDLPGRRYPSDNPQARGVERWYPNLPNECYHYHPLVNSDEAFHDRYGNGGFGKQTEVTNQGSLQMVSRFYIHSREPQSNPFHFIGTGDKEYKLSLLATYRSNVDTGVRTCIFASSDGGRQWFCKYEFSDFGEYEFMQVDSSRFGLNHGNAIVNQAYDRAYSGGLRIWKRSLVVPSASNREPNEFLMWKNVGAVAALGGSSVLTLRTSKPHELHTGHIIALVGDSSVPETMRWMLNNDIASNSAGNGLLFKVRVEDEYTISLFELVSSPDNPLPCRHIHHVNRQKDGWLIGTGEIYPNGWLLYFQMREADTFMPVFAGDEFKIIRLNSTEASAQRTMGAILTDEDPPCLIYASDHDLLERQRHTIAQGRSESIMRSSTGVFSCLLDEIDDRTNHKVCLEASEPCFYFQELDSLLVFSGQRGELGISFDKGKTWSKEHICAPIIQYQGNNAQRYYFDHCIIVRK